MEFPLYFDNDDGHPNDEQILREMLIANMR